MLASEEKVSPIAAEHKVDPEKPHWKDFYANYQQQISMKEVRKNRKLAVLNIPHKNDNAPFVFFIHGACARMGQFSPLIKHLSTHFNVIAFDRIGCGYSEKPVEANAYRGDAIFLDLCKLFEIYCAINKEILIISHSFGCSQSVRLYSKYGDCSTYKYRIKSLVLIGAHPFILGENIPLSVKGVMNLPYFVLDKMGPSMSATFRKNAIYEKSGAVLEEEMTFGGVNPSTMYSPFYLNIVPCSSSEFEACCKYGVNVLILHGKYDGIVPVEKAQEAVNKFKKLMRKDMDFTIEYELINDSAHQVQQEKPHIVQQIVDKFWINSTQKYN